MSGIAGTVPLDQPHNTIGVAASCVCGLPHDADIHTQDIDDGLGACSTFPTLTSRWYHARLVLSALNKAGITPSQIEVRIGSTWDGPTLLIDSSGTDVTIPADYPDADLLRAAMAPFNTERVSTVDLLPGMTVRVPDHRGEIVERVIDTVLDQPGLTSFETGETLHTVLFTRGRWSDWAQGITTTGSATWQVVP